MEDLLLSVSSPPEMDMQSFSFWVEGLTSEEAIQLRLEEFKRTGNYFGMDFPHLHKENNFRDLQDFVRYELLDQYRAFEVLEHYLAQPRLLNSQSLCIVTPEIQHTLIEKYWSLDDSFIRELLHKRLTKSRKDLEDASENTGLNIRRVTRQFDNIKSIQSALEDANNPAGNIFNFIYKNYLISSSLAKKYACVVFLLESKFNLVSKRRVMRVLCESLELCAALIMVFLTLDGANFSKLTFAEGTPEIQLFENPATAWGFVWKAFPSVDTFELDKQLLVSLRDLKSILVGDMLDSGCVHVRSKVNSALTRKLDSNKLRALIKSLLIIGANLSQTREYRDLFEDLITKVAEPLEEIGAAQSELNVILFSCYYVVSDISDSSRVKDSSRHDNTTLPHFKSQHSISRSEQIKKDWLRFLTFCRLAVTQLCSDRRPI